MEDGACRSESDRWGDSGETSTQDFVDWLSAPLDPSGGPAPAYITEVRYAGNDLPGATTETDIHKVRKVQEQLLKGVYGEDYQDDQALHRAVRVVDRISERFRKSWIDFYPDFENLTSARDTILTEETGLSYYTLNFTWQKMILDIYSPIVGDLPSTEYGTDIEYLRLHFTYPNETEDDLLDRFRKSVGGGHFLSENPWNAR